MAVRFCLLVLLCWMAGLIVTDAQGAGGQCLSCHPQHYESLAECDFCHRGDLRSTRSSLAHRDLIPARMAGFALPGDRKTQYGLGMLERLACRRCHVWGGKGSRLATDLGSVYYTKRVADLSEAIHNPVDQMPNFALDEGQVEALASALLKTSQVASPPETQVPVVVHFNSGTKEQEHPFDLHCGGCHRLLASRFGALGRGDAAPNLSGLLGGYYPELDIGKPWTEERLRKWLVNPRQFQENSLMPPVLLREKEVKEIVEILF